jgi:hypothetical protein
MCDICDGTGKITKEQETSFFQFNEWLDTQI